MVREKRNYVKIFLIALAIALVVVIIIFAIKTKQKVGENNFILENNLQSKEESLAEKQLREIEEIRKKIKENGESEIIKSSEEQLGELEKIRKITDNEQKKTGSDEAQLKELDGLRNNQNQ